MSMTSGRKIAETQKRWKKDVSSGPRQSHVNPNRYALPSELLTSFWQNLEITAMCCRLVKNQLDKMMPKIIQET